jgi:hypothetical protein
LFIRHRRCAASKACTAHARSSCSWPVRREGHSPSRVASRLIAPRHGRLQCQTLLSRAATGCSRRCLTLRSRRQKFGGHSPAVAQRSASDLDFARGETPKLLEMARSPASALPARPSVLHRCTSSRRCGNCGRARSRRPGGRRAPRGARTLVDRRGHPGRRRPGSLRCCSPSHRGRWAQASFLNLRSGEPCSSNRVGGVDRRCLTWWRVRGHACKASVRRRSTRRALAYRPCSSRRRRSREIARRKTRCCRHRLSRSPNGIQRPWGSRPQRTETRGRDLRRCVPPWPVRTSRQPTSRAPSPMKALPGWPSEIRVALPQQQRSLHASARRPTSILETG